MNYRNHILINLLNQFYENSTCASVSLGKLSSLPRGSPAQGSKHLEMILNSSLKLAHTSKQHVLFFKVNVFQGISRKMGAWGERMRTGHPATVVKRCWLKCPLLGPTQRLWLNILDGRENPLIRLLSWLVMLPWPVLHRNQLEHTALVFKELGVIY